MNDRVYLMFRFLTDPVNGYYFNDIHGWWDDRGNITNDDPGPFQLEIDGNRITEDQAEEFFSLYFAARTRAIEAGYGN